MNLFSIKQITNFVYDSVFVSFGELIIRQRTLVKGQHIGAFQLSRSIVAGRSIHFLPFVFLGMGKKAGGFYAVARGRNIGIYNSWDDCKAQVDGFPNARYKKFSASDEAQGFINEHKVNVGGTSSTCVTETVKSSSSLSRTGLLTSTTVGSSRSRTESTNNATKTSLIIPKSHNPSIVPSTNGLARTAQKRDFSSLKVTDDRVINKRTKIGHETPNKRADLKGFTVDEDGYVVVFTDGACTKNGRKAAKAGIGVWFGHNHPLNISEPVTGRQTNNTAEIQAAERAIKQAKKHGIDKLKVKTDSQFTINCVTKWLNNWRRNNWRLSSGGEVKNKEDLIKLDEAMRNMEIKWSYVAGHAGIEGNEAADRLAVAGAERAC